MAAQAAAVGPAPALDTGEKRGIKGVALGAVAALAGAHALTFFGRGGSHVLGSKRPAARFFFTSAAGKTRPFIAM